MNNRNIKVSSTNGNAKGKLSFVRIYKNGNKVAEVEMNQRNPLEYLQNIVNKSKYLDSLSSQLQTHLNCESNPGGELTAGDFEYLKSEFDLKLQIS